MNSHEAPRPLVMSVKRIADGYLIRWIGSAAASHRIVTALLWLPETEAQHIHSSTYWVHVKHLLKLAPHFQNFPTELAQRLQDVVNTTKDTLPRVS